jgi:hypothetical protein
VAVPMMKAGFLPDTMSTDLHTRSMNAGLKDILNLMSKFLAMGMPLDKVIAANTWNAARAIKQEQLGHLSMGAAADVAVLRVEKGSFGFTDQDGARLKGSERLRCELTLRDGKVVYDLNNLTGEDWDKLPADYRNLGDPRWDGMTEGGGGRGGRGEGPATRRRVHPDGQRFLMVKDAPRIPGAAVPGLVVVVGWFEELKARLPGVR